MRSSKVQKVCDEHNKSLRKVKHVYTYSPEKFLSSINGNLLITGSTKRKREELLVKAILHQREVSDEPVIIFSESRQFQERLISLAENDMIGELYVCSYEFRNYDFFYNMTTNQIVDYFTGLASLKGYRDTSELHDFAGSFIKILSTKAPVKLASINQFAMNNDTAIANVVGNMSVDYDIITGSTRGGISFRRLLGNAIETFGSLTTSACNTGFNISTAINSDCVIFINTETINYEFLSLYFLQELKSMVNRNFTVLFDDSILLNNKELLDFVNIIKQKSNINVVVSYENILTLPGTDNTNFFKKKMILVNDASIPPDELQRVLSEFGEYSHFESTTTMGTPPRLFFSFLKTESTAITPFSRGKVILEEVQGCDAVLSGHNGAEILVVKRF